MISPHQWIVFGIECIHAEQSDVKQKMITMGIKLMLEKKNQLRSNSVTYQNNSISDIYIAVWIVFLLTVLSEFSQQFYMPFHYQRNCGILFLYTYVL